MMFCFGFLTCLGLIVVWDHWRKLSETPTPATPMDKEEFETMWERK